MPEARWRWPTPDPTPTAANSSSCTRTTCCPTATDLRAGHQRDGDRRCHRHAPLTGSLRTAQGPAKDQQGDRHRNLIEGVYAPTIQASTFPSGRTASPLVHDGSVIADPSNRWNRMRRCELTMRPDHAGNRRQWFESGVSGDDHVEGRLEKRCRASRARRQHRAVGVAPVRQDPCRDRPAPPGLCLVALR